MKPPEMPQTKPPSSHLNLNLVHPSTNYNPIHKSKPIQSNSICCMDFWATTGNNQPKSATADFSILQFLPSSFFLLPSLPSSFFFTFSLFSRITASLIAGKGEEPIDPRTSQAAAIHTDVLSLILNHMRPDSQESPLQGKRSRPYPSLNQPRPDPDHNHHRSLPSVSPTPSPATGTSTANSAGPSMRVASPVMTKMPEAMRRGVGEGGLAAAAAPIGGGNPWLVVQCLRVAEGERVLKLEERRIKPWEDRRKKEREEKEQKEREKEQKEREKEEGSEGRRKKGKERRR